MMNDHCANCKGCPSARMSGGYLMWGESVKNMLDSIFVTHLRNGD